MPSNETVPTEITLIGIKILTAETIKLNPYNNKNAKLIFFNTVTIAFFISHLNKEYDDKIEL